MPKVLHCCRCNHSWTARVEDPEICPLCHSPYWRKPRLRSGRYHKQNDPLGLYEDFTGALKKGKGYL